MENVKTTEQVKTTSQSALLNEEVVTQNEEPAVEAAELGLEEQGTPAVTTSPQKQAVSIEETETAENAVESTTLNKETEFLSSKEAAKLLGFDEGKTLYLARSEQIPHIKIQGVNAFHFVKSSLLAWKELYNQGKIKLTDKKNTEFEGLLKISKVAKDYHLTPSAIRKLAEKGEIPCKVEPYGKGENGKAKKQYFFKKAELDNWLLSMEKSPKFDLLPSAA